MPQECDFFLEIFEFKNFSFEERIIVQGLKPPRKVKAGLAPGHEVPFKAKNNRETVVVCVIHVVKRPSKRSVLVK